MVEIEVKILDVNVSKIKKTLRKIGAKQILKPTLFQEWYFRIPGITKKEKEFYSFRLRSEGKKNILTIKIKKKDASYLVSKETEIEVSSAENTKTLLAVLRFKVFRQRKKIREIYKIDNVKIMIDQYPGIKPYIEIESTRKKDVSDFVRKLGYSFKDTTSKTATEIIREAGLNPDNLS